MKASKKVFGSALVSGLAIALTVTAVTGNGVSTTADKKTAEVTKLEANGIAGLASVMNGYDVEAADFLDKYVSVEKADTTLVASAAETEAATDADAANAETEADENVTESTSTEDGTTDCEETEKPVSKEEKEWQNKLMAKVDDFLYVRADADANSKIVGKMYKGDRAVVKKVGKTWTKIASGNVTGYVKNKFCVTGTDALDYAKEHCGAVAKASIDGLRVRESASTEAKVIKTVASGERLKVNTEAKEKDGWVAVKLGSDTCYVSEDYVEVSLDTGKAITLEEEQAAIKAEEEKKAAEAAAAAEQKKKEAEAAANSSSSSSSNSGSGSSSQTASSGTTQNASLAATADEETLLAALVQCEAGGTSVQCMTAVGAVVVNRVRSGGFANSIYGVIYQRGQFGPASSGRLEARLASGVSSSARQAARAALSGSDPTGGAKYFKLASSGHAGTVIGPIVFY